jgi:peptidoglycan/LPS O-acetylase OafA/YrhL
VTPRHINFRNLDALRGLLAVYVALGHCRWLLWGGHAAWLASAYQPWEAVPAYGSAALRYGREAVMVFFVLSGFFIHYRAAATRSAGATDLSARAFYRRRWHRLAPPYYFALAATVVLDAIARTWWPTLYLSRTGDAYLDQSFARTGYTLESIVPALLLLPSSLGVDFGSNGPLWSLAYEAIYYALYPWWLQVRRWSRQAAFVGVPIACFSLYFVPFTAFPLVVLAHYPVWLAGALIAERMVNAGVTTRTAVAGATLFAGGVVLRLLSPTFLFALIAAVLFGAGAVMFFAAVQWRNKLLTVAEFLGLRSYTIYIVHFPLLAVISAWVIHAHGGRPLHGWLAVSGAAGCIAFGCVCFEISERHFLHSRYHEESAAP